MNTYTTSTIFIYDEEYRKQYEKQLQELQKKHLESVLTGLPQRAWQPCAHDSCSNCHGTGIGRFGGICVHGLVCNCPKCSPFC